jgi:hypothetical protein
LREDVVDVDLVVEIQLLIDGLARAEVEATLLEQEGVVAVRPG